MARHFFRFLGAFALALIFAGLLIATAKASPVHYTIDSAHTTVRFEVRKLGMTRQSGEFGSVAGTVALDPESGGGSVNIEVDTRSIRADSEMAEKFLRGPNVLNVEEFTEIAYRADHLVYLDGKPARIDGELTMLGVTRPVSLKVTGYSCAGAHRCTLDATAVFKRSEFGMTSYLALVSDEVKLAIHGVTAL